MEIGKEEPARGINLTSVEPIRGIYSYGSGRDHLRSECRMKLGGSPERMPGPGAKLAKTRQQSERWEENQTNGSY